MTIIKCVKRAADGLCTTGEVYMDRALPAGDAPASIVCADMPYTLTYRGRSAVKGWGLHDDEAAMEYVSESGSWAVLISTDEAKRAGLIK